MRTSLLSSLALSGVANALQYGYNHSPISKDPEELQSAFPELDDVKLYAPPFTNPDSIPETFADGTDGPTDEGKMEYFLRDIASRNSYMTYHTADFHSEEGRGFPYIYMSASNGTTCDDDKKLRVWLQGAVHGNEPAGDVSLLAFLGKMDAEPEWAADLLSKIDFFVLPRYNPDGVFYFQRYFATNFDPNRDHIKLARQHTRNIKGLFMDFAPHVAADMHEYSGSRRTGPGKDITIAADALFSAAKNLNIDEEIREMSEELFSAQMGKDQEAGGFRWAPYATEGTAESDDEVLYKEAVTDAKIGRNAMGMTQSITILCETRGIGLAEQYFERRTASALQMAVSIVQTAADNAEEVYETIEGGRKRFAESTEDIVITDGPELKKIKFPMANVTDGRVLQYPITFASTTPSIANLTRSRPEAYVIPSAWADLVERLEISGLEAVKLPNGFSGSVEALNVTSIALEDSYYEGVVRATVETKVVEKDIKLPPGSFWVSTKQVNAALAFVALEPENIDSYASFNIIALEKGDEYPIYRVVA